MENSSSPAAPSHLSSSSIMISASTSTSIAPEPQPGPSGVNTRKFAQTTTHDLKKPIISVIDADDSDSDVEYHSSYQRSPQPSTSKMVSPIRIKLHPKNPSKNTVLTAPDLQLNWDSSSDSNSSDDVILLPFDEPALPIDLTNETDSDDDFEFKKNFIAQTDKATKRKLSATVNTVQSTASTSTIESANPRDAIPPSVIE